MKKILVMILALCLVFSIAAEAAAAGKPVFKKQPQTATTSKKGVVSFSVDVKSGGAFLTYTWYFVNPANGKKVSGRKLSKSVKGVKVVNPNSKNITLKKVPESMHGWQVYCHVTGNGYKVDSEPATLYVYGKDPEDVPKAKSSSKKKKSSETEETAETTETKSSSKKKSSKTEETAETKSEKSEQAEGSDEPTEDETVVPEASTFSISATGRYLYPLDTKGSVTATEPVSTLEFTGTGSVLVKGEYPIKSWSVNGMRFEPAEPVAEFKLLNITQATSLSVTVRKPSAADAQLDESHMCKVTCKGCTFTFLRKGLKSVTEGEVPSGAIISIVGSDSNLLANGYRINGAEPAYQNLASFRLTVTGDVTITLE